MVLQQLKGELTLGIIIIYYLLVIVPLNSDVLLPRPSKKSFNLWDLHIVYQF